MRYRDGGGVGPNGRACREQIRRQAAGMFGDGMSGVQVAAALEISTKSAYAWRRAWAAGGEQALASKGAPGPDPVLSERLVHKLIAKLNEGTAAAGWAEDERWSLARIRTLIGWMFHITVSIATVSQILHRAGFTPQQPIQRAAERDETAIEHWRRYQWPAVRVARRLGVTRGWSGSVHGSTGLVLRRHGRRP